MKTENDNAEDSAAPRCYAGAWAPTMRLRYTGRTGEDDCDTLINGCVGDAMELHNSEVFFMPDGDDVATGGYFLLPREFEQFTA